MDDSLPHAPRKKPRQGRSRALVDAILEATERVLAEDGADGLTTTRVAELAGVSVGSLYQYYPSKESLLAAVIERRVDLDRRWLEEMAASVPPDLPLRQLVRMGIERTIALFREEHSLYRELVGSMQAVERDRVVAEMIAESVRLLAERLRGQALAVDDADRAAWIVIMTQVGVLRSAAAERPELLSDPRLADDLERMCMRYLTDEP